MKTVKKAIITFLVLAMFVSIVPGSYSSAAKKAKLNKTKLTLKVGKTYKLKLKNNKKKVKWSSTKKKVATVTSKGKVTAKKAGSAKIVAKVGKKKYTCKVTVKNDSSVKKPNTNPSTNTNTGVTNGDGTVAGNIKKLADYIQKYGRTDESGYKYIWTVDEEFLGDITYKADKDSFVFGYACFDEYDDLESVITMEFTNNQDVFNVEWVSVYGICEGKIDRKTYTKETGYSLTITSSPSEDTTYNESLMRLAEADLKLASLYWEDLLREAGLTPKDIGFETWK